MSRDTAARTAPGWKPALRCWSSRTMTVLTRGAEGFAADRGHRLAAQVSFHVLFSLFPLVLLLTAVLGLFFGDETARERVVDFLTENVPLLAEQGEAIREAVEGVSRGAPALGLGAVFVVAWSSSTMMAAVRDALNVAWNSEDNRPFFRGKAMDLLLVFGLGVAVIGSFGLTLAGRLLDSEVDLGPLNGVIGGGFWIWLLLSFAAFLLVYRLVPTPGHPVREIWPGALVAALMFEALKNLFGVYLDNFAAYNAIYGGVGVVVAFLLFVYLASNVLIYGAELASEWPAVARGEHDEDDEEKKPLPQRVKRLVRGLFLRPDEGRGR